tara:strand:- start:169 stop:492 length:324 start_codon:yes stop_codon:yes gene_type:complete
MKPKIVQPTASPGLSQEELDAQLEEQRLQAERDAAAARNAAEAREKKRKEEEKRKAIANAQQMEIKRVRDQKAQKFGVKQVAAQQRVTRQTTQSGGAYSSIAGTGYN